MKILQIDNEDTLKELIKDCFRNVLKEQTVAAEEPPPKSDICRIDGAVEITEFTKSTIYGKVHKKTIPHIKQGGLLRFSRKALIQWLIDGNVKTEEQNQSEFDKISNEYLVSKKIKK